MNRQKSGTDRHANGGTFGSTLFTCFLLGCMAIGFWQCAPITGTHQNATRSSTVAPAPSEEKPAPLALPIHGIFDGTAGSALPEHWAQDTSMEFAPAGKTEVIAETIDVPVKAVKLTAGEKPVLVYTADAFPVQTGDCIAVRVYFKGAGLAQVGYYGYRGHDAPAGEAVDTKTHSFKTYWTEWDARIKVFEIDHPQVTAIRIFFSIPAGTTMSFANITVRKLSQEEISLISPKANREVWRERTQGVNLARGKKVAFDPEPTYELTTKGESEAFDLTDGKLGPDNDMLWFYGEAVCWYRAYNGVTMIVDLGEVQPVKKAVIRINGGRLGGVTFPAKLSAWVSKDGKDFHQTAGLAKVAATEYYLSDWKALYYLPESEDDNGVTYVYPFELPVQADARYVAIRAPVYTPLMMICDELAVIKADEACQRDGQYNRAYQAPPSLLTHRTSIVRPRMDVFYLPDNVRVPNWLILDDRREDTSGKFGYIIDLPASIEFTEETSYPAFTRTLTKTETAAGRKRLHFVPETDWKTFTQVMRYGFGPFFFFATDKNVPENEKYVTFTTTVDGNPLHVHRAPLEIISIPKVPELKEFTTSLAWTEDRHAINWPDYLHAQRHLGFNTISMFPLSNYIHKNSEARDKYQALLGQAREQGFRIRLIMSPTAMLNSSWHPDADEYKCVDRQTKKRSACPAYRGTYYQDMLERIGKGVAEFPSDYVTFDEESWEPTQLNECMKCSRCDALRQSKGMGWKEYLEWVQADYLKGFKGAVAKGAGGNKMPIIGYYALNPDVLHQYGCAAGKISFLGYQYLFPEWSDETQPSYYGNDSRVLHDSMRKVFQVVQNPKAIIPWLSAGSGAYGESAMKGKSEQQLLEAFMNGAGGLLYYKSPSFESPLDYCYIASALTKIAPCEELLMKGELLELAGSNKHLLYTARRHGKDLLLLIGNYGAVAEAKTQIELPGGTIAAVTDLNGNQAVEFSGHTLSVTVPADGFGFYHVRY